MKSLAIIGLDPGTTSAYAILSLDGNVLKLSSTKAGSLNLTIAEITKKCLPVIVACDKSKIPTYVKNFATKVGAQTITPPADLQKQYKRDLVGGIKTKNDHEQDCLAAALYAHGQWLPKLKKIEKFLSTNDVPKASFTRIAIKYDLNFQLIKKLLQTKDRKVVERVLQDDKTTKTDFLQLLKRLHQTIDEAANLKRKLHQLREDHGRLMNSKKFILRSELTFQRKLDNLLKFKDLRIKQQETQITKLHEQNRILREQMQEHYNFLGKVQGHQLVRKLSSLSYLDYSACQEEIKPNDVLWINKPQIYSEKVIEALAGKGIILLSAEKFPQLIQNTFQTQFIDNPIASNQFYTIIESKINQNILIDKIIEQHKER